MKIWEEEWEPGCDYGRLYIRFDQDDSFKLARRVSGDVQLEVSLYAHEARELIEVLKPLAAEPDAE